MSFEYDWRSTVLYALTIGATRDELDYLHEARGPRVFPTFAVVAAFGPVSSLYEKAGCDMTHLLHGSQSLRWLAPLPPEGRLVTVASVKNIYDQVLMAVLEIETHTTLNGEPCFDSEWSLIVRGAGGFGGQRPPRSNLPKLPTDREPDFTELDQTRPEQALLYRLNGDLNPLHADPEFAKDAGFETGPVLHGLCTLGYMARAIARHACGGDANRLASLRADFRRPVWPGEALSTTGYCLDDGTVVAEAHAGGRAEAVVTGCLATLRKP